MKIYRWDLFSDVLIFDTARFAVQDRLFTRLAYYLEKRGFRGRLLGNARLAGRHGWNAHDYGAEGLAAFYSAAAETSFVLNPEELAVRRLAADEGIIVPSHGRFVPAAGQCLPSAVRRPPSNGASFSRTSRFTGSSFPRRRTVTSACVSGTPSPREKRASMNPFLDSLGYDSADPTLVVNEFQAYLMQQPLRFAAAYFERFIRLHKTTGWPLIFSPGQLVKKRGPRRVSQVTVRFRRRRAAPGA